jgi:hypothetical protein
MRAGRLPTRTCAATGGSDRAALNFFGSFLFQDKKEHKHNLRSAAKRKSITDE